jgi:hypothetical protein
MAKSKRPVRYTKDFAPEWFYPFARIVHQEVERRAHEQHAQGVHDMHGEFDYDGDPEKILGFKLVALSARNAFMAGVVQLGPTLFRRYKLRIPKSRFHEFGGGAGENVNAFTE